MSNDTQEAVSALLEDLPWITSYLTSNRRLLAERCTAVSSAIALCGLTCIPAVSGMFVWVDARPLLSAFRLKRKFSGAVHAGPMEPTWDDEADLQADLLTTSRILFTPGNACHSSVPGYFRCCYMWMTDPTSIDVALQRLRVYADSLGVRPAVDSTCTL